MAGFPKAECLSFIKNDTNIPILHISKYGASMAKESAQKENFYVSQLLMKVVVCYKVYYSHLVPPINDFI